MVVLTALLAVAGEPDVLIRCAADAVGPTSSVGPAAATLLAQLTDHLPLAGPIEIGVRRTPQASRVQVRGRVDAAALPEWLETYAYVAVAPGVWTNDFGARVTLDGDRVVLARADGGTVPKGKFPRARQAMPSSGCAVSSPLALRVPGSSGAGPTGAVVRLTDAQHLTARVRTQNQLFRAAPPLGAAVARGGQPAPRARLNVVDVVAVLRSLPDSGSLFPAVGPLVDAAWLDPLSDNLAPGAELIGGPTPAIWLPVRSGDAAAAVRSLGVADAQGRVSLPRPLQPPLFVSAVGGAVVVRADPAWTAAAQGQPLFSAEDAVERPGVHWVDERGARVWALADGADVSVAYSSSSPVAALVPYAARLAAPRQGGVPRWPVGEPPVGSPPTCKARFHTSPGGDVENLAVWGCAAPFAAAVREAMSGWVFARDPQAYLSMREREVEVPIPFPAGGR
jgi:hypothetical protein